MSEPKPDPKSTPGGATRPHPVAATDAGTPVKKLVFNLPPFDVPGKDAAGGLDGMLEPKPRSWVITYRPASLDFKLEYFEHIAGRPPIVAYVPRERISVWYPYTAKDIEDARAESEKEKR